MILSVTGCGSSIETLGDRDKALKIDLENDYAELKKSDKGIYDALIDAYDGVVPAVVPWN